MRELKPAAPGEFSAPRPPGDGRLPLESIFVGIALPWLLLGLGGWIGYQLIRQNGRILLRLEGLEDHLDGIAEALEGAGGKDLARSGRRPLSESHLNRNGLTVGTPAPDFRLPRLDGGDLSLSELRGSPMLLVFSDPHCGPCDALAADLQRASVNGTGIRVLMVSRGEVSENQKKVRQHRLTFPIVLQNRWEISRLYATFATPAGYLIDEQGVVATEVAIGGEAIRTALSSIAMSARRKEAAAMV